MRVRVVCGLSDTIASLVPTSRLSSVDFPAFGRPTSETKPAFIALHRARLQLVLVADHRRRDPADADAVDPAPFGIEDLRTEAVELERFAHRRHATDMVHEIAA